MSDCVPQLHQSILGVLFKMHCNATNYIIIYYIILRRYISQTISVRLGDKDIINTLHLLLSVTEILVLQNSTTECQTLYHKVKDGCGSLQSLGIDSKNGWYC